MDFRQLTYFIAAAEEENFGQAARRLHIAQPALSRQIRAMEELMGVSLFERLPRGLRLSPAGAAFLEEARAIVNRHRSAVEHARNVQAGVHGRLNIGFIEPSLFHWTPPEALREFRTRYPMVAVELEPMQSLEQGRALRAGRIDAGFVVGPSGEEGNEFGRLTVLVDHFMLALPANHPAVSRAVIRLADLANEPFLCIRRVVAPRYVDQVMMACAAAGVHPRLAQELNNETAVLALVSVGMGIGLVSSAIKWRKPDKVVLRDSPDLDVSIPLDLIWRRDDQRPTLRNFIGIVETLTRYRDQVVAP